MTAYRRQVALNVVSIGTSQGPVIVRGSALAYARNRAAVWRYDWPFPVALLLLAGGGLWGVALFCLVVVVLSRAALAQSSHLTAGDGVIETAVPLGGEIVQMDHVKEARCVTHVWGTGAARRVLLLDDDGQRLATVKWTYWSADRVSDVFAALNIPVTGRWERVRGWPDPQPI